MFAGVFVLSFFVERLFVLAAVLAAIIFTLVTIRRPVVRMNIRRELPPEVSDVEVEAKVKASQRAFGVKLWLFVFGVPMLVIVAMMIANNMSVRIQ